MTPMSSNLADYGQFCIDLTPKRLDLADSEHIYQDLTPRSKIYTVIYKDTYDDFISPGEVPNLSGKLLSLLPEK